MKNEETSGPLRIFLQDQKKEKGGGGDPGAVAEALSGGGGGVQVDGLAWERDAENIPEAHRACPSRQGKYQTNGDHPCSRGRGKKSCSRQIRTRGGRLRT